MDQLTVLDDAQRTPRDIAPVEVGEYGVDGAPIHLLSGETRRAQ